MDIRHTVLKLTTFCIDRGVIITPPPLLKCQQNGCTESDYFPVDLSPFKLTLDTTQKNLIFEHLIVSSFPWTDDKKSSFLIWDLFLLETPLITFNVINTELPSFELDGLSFQQKRSRSPLIIPEMPFIGSSPAYHQCARIRVPSSLRRFLPFNKWNLYL